MRWHRSAGSFRSQGEWGAGRRGLVHLILYPGVQEESLKDLSGELSESGLCFEKMAPDQRPV